jgi:hypothetical protein
MVDWQNLSDIPTIPRPQSNNILFTLQSSPICPWFLLSIGTRPFLNPQTAGYGSVAVHVIAIMLLFLFTQRAVNATTRVLGRAREVAPPQL